MKDNVTIGEEYEHEILSITGFPILNFDDEDFEVTQDQFHSLIIRKTLRAFYKWFPKKSYEQFSVNGAYEIMFPRSTIYNAQDIRTNNQNRGGGGRTSNALINARNYSSGSLSGGNVYGTGNDYGMTSANIIASATVDTMQARYKNERIVVDTVNRVVTGYTNLSSQLNITWAEYDTNFDNIPFSRIDECIRLAQAYWLRYLGVLRSQQTGGLPQEWDADSFKDLADKFEEEVMTAWKNFTKVSISRG